MGRFAEAVGYNLDIKRQIYELLKAGFNDITQNTLVNNVKVNPYGNYTIAVHTRDPLWQSGSPAQKSEVPCVTIHRLNDIQTQEFIGDVAGYDEDTGDFGIGRLINELYELRIWSFNSSLRDMIYADLTKILLVGQNQYLRNNTENNDGTVTNDYNNGKGYSINFRFISGSDDADHNFFPGTPMYWTTVVIGVVNSLMIGVKPLGDQELIGIIAEDIGDTYVAFASTEPSNPVTGDMYIVTTAAVWSDNSSILANQTATWAINHWEIGTPVVGDLAYVSAETYGLRQYAYTVDDTWIITTNRIGIDVEVSITEQV